MTTTTTIAIHSFIHSIGNFRVPLSLFNFFFFVFGLSINSDWPFYWLTLTLSIDVQIEYQVDALFALRFDLLRFASSSCLSFGMAEMIQFPWQIFQFKIAIAGARRRSLPYWEVSASASTIWRMRPLAFLHFMISYLEVFFGVFSWFALTLHSSVFLSLWKVSLHCVRELPLSLSFSLQQRKRGKMVSELAVSEIICI